MRVSHRPARERGSGKAHGGQSEWAFLDGGVGNACRSALISTTLMDANLCLNLQGYALLKTVKRPAEKANPAVAPAFWAQNWARGEAESRCPVLRSPTMSTVGGNFSESEKDGEVSLRLPECDADWPTMDPPTRLVSCCRATARPCDLVTPPMISCPALAMTPMGLTYWDVRVRQRSR